MAGAATTTSTASIGPMVALQVNFDLNSSQLRPASTQVLTNLAEVLKGSNQRGRSFKVVGHTDVTGALDYNMALSRERAERVREFLVARGVEPQRLTAKGMGPTQLLPNLPAQSEQHRRVVVQLGS